MKHFAMYLMQMATDAPPQTWGAAALTVSNVLLWAQVRKLSRSVAALGKKLKVRLPDLEEQ